MVQSCTMDEEAPINGVSSRQSKYGSARPASDAARGPRHYLVLGSVVAFALVAMACFAAYSQSPGPVVMESAAEKALKLEMSKRKYDSAKQRVAKLHNEFDKLKAQLEGQVKSLDSARGDLVTRIKSAEGVPVEAEAQETAPADSAADFADADVDFGDKDAACTTTLPTTTTWTRRPLL